MNPTKTRGIVVALVGAVAVLVALGVAVGIGGIRSGEGPGSSLGIANEPAEARADGSMAPDFSLPALAGEGVITLSEFRGDVVVLNFWASWCGPCRREAPALQGAWEDYRDRGVQFMGQQPEYDGPRRPVLLAVDQQLGEGPGLWVPPEGADASARSKSGSIRTWSSSAHGAGPSASRRFRIRRSSSSGLTVGGYAAGLSPACWRVCPEIRAPWRTPAQRHQTPGPQDL
jgi:hypothetical protein